MSIEETKKKRLEYLKRVYEKVDGDENRGISMWEVGDELNLGKEENRKIFNYLKGEYFLRAWAIGGLIAITHGGIKEIEFLLENPKKETRHFPSINVINIKQMVNSQIQQSSDKPSQVQLGSITESEKRGYAAGVVSILICIIFIFLVFSTGWDLTGQIFTAFSALFGILGIGCVIKPDSVGQVTLHILQNVGNEKSIPRKSRHRKRH